MPSTSCLCSTLGNTSFYSISYYVGSCYKRTWLYIGEIEGLMNYIRSSTVYRQQQNEWTKNSVIIIIIMGRMGIYFTSVATSWWGEACCLLLCFPTGTCVLCCTLCHSMTGRIRWHRLMTKCVCIRHPFLIKSNGCKEVQQPFLC